MPRKPDIIFLESRTQRIKRHWKGMSRIGRLGLISIIFGLIGLVTSWLFFVLQYLSVPFSIVGLGVGLVATVLGFINNELKYGFWLPVLGLIVSGIGLAIAGINYGGRTAWEQDQLRKNDPALRLVGLWESTESDQSAFLNFTNDGKLLLTRTATDSKSPSPAGSKDQISGSEVNTKTRDRLASYSVLQGNLFLSHRHRNSAAQCEFQYQIIDGDQLVIDHAVVACSQFPIVGKWRLISQPETLKEQKKVDAKLTEYQSNLTNLKSQRETLNASLVRMHGERDSVLEKLRPYEAGAKPADEVWEVHARELKILVDQIGVVETRVPTLEMAIVRLESAIRNRIRETHMDQLGLSDEELAKLLRIKIEIDDELKTAADAGPVEDFELHNVVEQEQARKTGANESSTRGSDNDEREIKDN